MIGVILAAGMARRLRPLTDDKPKCLLEIGNKTLLEGTVNAMRQAGITEFCIVTGYCAEMIRSFLTARYPALTFHFLHNADYEHNNNIYSLWMAGEVVRGRDFLLMDSDILCDPETVGLIARQAEPALALNRHELGDEEIKVVVDDKGHITEINKTCDPATALGESVGIEKITADYSTALYKELETMILKEGLVDVFYERAFERLIPQGHTFLVVDTTDYFSYELDTPEDFMTAQEKFGRKSNITISSITTAKEMEDFIHVVDDIYAGCPQYVPDLESDIRDFFNPKKNAGLDFSDVKPFIAYRNGVPVGRIVGIINRNANEKWKTPIVRFSMIEFIDDTAVSKALLDAVAEWGRQHGMNTIHGPLGITDFDKEGMLVEDFHMKGSMNTIYNPPYYPVHMEIHGMQKAADWIQARIDIPKQVPDRYARISKYVTEQMKLRVIKLTNKEIIQGGYGHKVFALFNEAYEPLFGFSALSMAQVDEYLKKYVSLIDKQLIPVVVNEDGDVVAAAITMGCLTEAMQKSKGKLWPTGWWHLLKALKWKHEESIEMLLIGVLPKYQGMGVNALIFNDLIPIYNRCHYKWAETGPQLEDNIRELSQWKAMNPKFVKRRRCYSKKI